MPYTITITVDTKDELEVLFSLVRGEKISELRKDIETLDKVENSLKAAMDSQQKEKK